MVKRKKGKHFSFGKSVSDNGWSKFVNILKYKLAWQGKQLIKVDKWYPSSQICHDCGFQEWECPKCGSIHNRDKKRCHQYQRRSTANDRLNKSAKYRGTHGNQRLWRECKTLEFFGTKTQFSSNQEAPASIGGSTFTRLFHLNK